MGCRKHEHKHSWNLEPERLNGRALLPLPLPEKRREDCSARRALRKRKAANMIDFNVQQQQQEEEDVFHEEEDVSQFLCLLHRRSRSREAVTELKF